jgi:ketosteroid isomerase-like protein
MRELLFTTSTVALLIGIAGAKPHENRQNTSKAMTNIEDRLALKEVVDTFSNLADKKDVHAQVQLFTPDATSQTYVGGKLVSDLTGRDALEKAFGAFLANFTTVYHFNGQQVVKLDGDKATGTSYCMVTLIGDEGGKRMKTSIGVIYEDQFVREGGRWLMAKRRANFDWQEKREMGS